jgi:hypothetical protein
MLRVNNLIGFGSRPAAVDDGSDPYFSSVVLLVGFDGSDGATSATDESPVGRALTFVGNAQLDTAQSKFGGASLLCDGTGDRVTVANHADFQFGSGQFTIETFVRFATLDANSRAIMGKGLNVANTAEWTFTVSSSLADVIFAFSSNGGVSNNEIVTAAGVNPTTGVWYHFACDRDGSNKFRIYVDGVMVGSSTIASAINTNTGTVGIGSQLGAAAVVDTHGWFDEVRITKGVARYASDGGFTVPAAAYPRS